MTHYEVDMDKIALENSEVFREYARIMNMQKKAETQTQEPLEVVEDNVIDVRLPEESIEDVAEELAEELDLADDFGEEDFEDEGVDEDFGDMGSERLNVMARKYAKDGDTKTAYLIEKTARSIQHGANKSQELLRLADALDEQGCVKAADKIDSFIKLAAEAESDVVKLDPFDVSVNKKQPQYYRWSEDVRRAADYMHRNYNESKIRVIQKMMGFRGKDADGTWGPQSAGRWAELPFMQGGEAPRGAVSIADYNKYIKSGDVDKEMMSQTILPALQRGMHGRALPSKLNAGDFELSPEEQASTPSELLSAVEKASRLGDFLELDLIGYGNDIDTALEHMKRFVAGKDENLDILVKKYIQKVPINGDLKAKTKWFLQNYKQ